MYQEKLLPQELNEIEMLTAKAERSRGAVAIGCRQMRFLLESNASNERFIEMGNESVLELEEKLDEAERKIVDLEEEVKEARSLPKGVAISKAVMKSLAEVSR